MDTTRHDLEGLFSQLGLPNSPEAIEGFFKEHHLPKDVPLEHAAIWSTGQAQFIHEAIADDSDWCEIVDQLDAQLRH